MSFRPSDLAGCMARRRRNAPDGFLRETFFLPREQARAKANVFLKAYPKAAFMSEVERWRELPDGAIEFHHAPAADRLMAGEEDKLEIVPERTVEVRETRTLFRLTPATDNDLSRSSRKVAVVAADTEDEARQIASMHDAFGATGGIRIFLSPTSWKRPRHKYSAM